MNDSFDRVIGKDVRQIAAAVALVEGHLLELFLWWHHVQTDDPIN